VDHEEHNKEDKMKKLFCFLFALLLAAAPAFAAVDKSEAMTEEPKMASENTTKAQPTIDADADDPGTDAPDLDYDSDSGD
jgi:ABC-type oligopeptide transport system substrate-binding subunit